MVVQLSYLTNLFSEFFVKSEELLCYQQEFDFPKKVSGRQAASSLNKRLEVSEWAEGHQVQLFAQYTAEALQTRQKPWENSGS